jgi:hypothetical protein
MGFIHAIRLDNSEAEGSLLRRRPRRWSFVGAALAAAVAIAIAAGLVNSQDQPHVECEKPVINQPVTSTFVVPMALACPPADSSDR